MVLNEEQIQHLLILMSQSNISHMDIIKEIEQNILEDVKKDILEIATVWRESWIEWRSKYGSITIKQALENYFKDKMQ